MNLKLTSLKIFLLMLVVFLLTFTGCIKEEKKYTEIKEAPKSKVEIDIPSVLPDWNDGDYHTFYETFKKLESFNTQFPDLVKLFSIGKSVGYRDIFCIKITNESNNNKKFSCIIDGCIHGNEWEGGEACLYLVEYLLINYKTNKTVFNILNESEIYIIPILNPDGRENDDRFNENGIDLNRNFDVHFGRILGYSIPLGKIFGFIKIKWLGIPKTRFFVTNSGRHPFSEPESRALRDFMEKIDNGYFSFYLSCHTATHSIVSPSYDVKRPEYEITSQELAVFDYAKNWVASNTEYRAANSKGGYGTGCSMSWCYKEFRIPSFTFELLSPDYDPWFGHGKHDHLVHWMKTGIPVFLYMLVNIENLHKWDIPDINPYLPEGIPPKPLN